MAWSDFDPISYFPSKRDLSDFRAAIESNGRRYDPDTRVDVEPGLIHTVESIVIETTVQGKDGRAETGDPDLAPMSVTG